MKLLTTAEVAERLGVHRSRVGVLIKEGRLPAQRFGRVLLVAEKDLRLVGDRKPGRPAANTVQGKKRTKRIAE
ncbi:MAG: hypothetical protein DMF61_25830 [Blastocatellia bacterium AA13]|nr:MAG: hypothetical protein DMF61_25830 [Blastocatellia bacterium AA13]